MQLLPVPRRPDHVKVFLCMVMLHWVINHGALAISAQLASSCLRLSRRHVLKPLGYFAAIHTED